MEQFELFYKVLDSLNIEQVDYILIGGFAVILYGMPRFTQDLDIIINLNEDNIDKLVLFSIGKLKYF